MLFTVVLSLVILACILIVLVILAQNSKGGGLSSQFGGSGASNMIGVKKTGDLLENLTWGLIVAIFVLVIASSFILKPSGEAPNTLRDRAQQEAQPLSAPGLDLDTTVPTEGDGSTLQNDLQNDSVN